MRALRPLFLLLVLFALASPALGQGATYRPNEILLLLKDARTLPEVKEALYHTLPQGAAIKEFAPLGKKQRYVKVVFENSTFSELELQRFVSTVPGVDATSLNYLVKFLAEPNDAFYATQWAMEDINVEPVWDITTGGTMANGRRIGVAISDDAIMVGHPDLAGNIWPGSPGMLGGEAHGTEVASVVGAVGNNGIGIAGVNWDVEILSATDASDLSDNIVIFEMALDLRQEFNSTQGTSGLMVVSVTASWILGTGTPELCNGFSVDLFADMADAGIIVVTCGDNAQVDLDNIPSYPSSCALQEHLVVTSYGPLGQTPFAFGDNSVHLLAPGIDIPAATVGGGYTVVEGNSYAIPHLAGAVALLYSIPCGGFAQLVMDDPQAAATMVRSAILDNTTPVAGADALTITGGKLNVHAAYLALMAQCPQCDTLTVNLATPAGNNAQYALLRGTGSSVTEGVGDAIQFCAEEGCFTATVVDGTQQPLDGTFTVEFDGAVIANGSIVNGEMSFDFGTVTSGCTNFTAQNFDPLANCDDGSCCTENWVTIALIAAEQVANGTAQLSVESGGTSLYNGPVEIAYDSDAAVSYGLVNVCAPNGCLLILAQEGDVALQPSGLAYTTSGPQLAYYFPIGEATSTAVPSNTLELCDGIDNDCDGEVDEDFIWYVDNDGDGWGLAATAQVFCTPPNGGFSQLLGDCDDADPNVNPGMPDPCSAPDGIDNDCSGTADDGEQFFWYPDLDGDGFGDQGGELIACTQPPGYVGQFGDCDDNDPNTYPGAEEICDGLDNDCDGVIDEGFTWYTDADGDGYGDDATAQNSCTPIPNGVLVGGDCDDTDPDLIGTVTLVVYSQEGFSEATAHYVITQGSTVIEADMLLIDDGNGFAVGSVATCLGSGCFTISVSPVDEPLFGLAFVVNSANPGAFIDFSISEGFFGTNGIPAEELCDGLDNDCDGEVDEDFRWYTDADGDGFGDDATMQISCTPIPGAVQVGGDCNDADPNIGTIGSTCDDGDADTYLDTVQEDCNCSGVPVGTCPPGEIFDCNGNCAPQEWLGDGFCDDGSYEHNGNTIFFNCEDFANDLGDCGEPCSPEICDGIDNDCDGLVDEDFFWYADLDGDGYGDPNTGILSCTPMPGMVNVGGDCDDTDPTINPGALEACDGIDSNCDGIADAELTGCTDPTACNYDPQAVCPDGSCIDGSTTTGEEVYSPDWTATDTDGNTVNLYEILAEGKTVVLDLFAAWCDPSIAMFTSGFLNDWNDDMGPAGTDDIRIIAIAVDQSSGDLTPFIASAEWPMIVNGGEELGELYAGAGLLQPVVPTVLMICPDRSATVLYGGVSSTLPFTGQFIYDPVAAREVLAANCSCRGTPCVTNIGCMDPNACNYDPTATCPTGDCIQATTWYQDADGDTYGNADVSLLACEQPTGYVSNNLDCDDTNAAVYPGVQGANSCSTCEEEDQLWVLENLSDYQELGAACATACNGAPDFAACLSACIAPQVPIAAECTACLVEFMECLNSCNGCYENCEQLFFICSGTTDLDGDGWSTPQDCDDTNPTIHPFAPEICDGLDNDCNGLVDDGGTIYYTDADGDGFGDPSTGMLTCTPPTGAVPNGDDCDDTDPAVYPGALEVCDGIDNDCDGIVDEGSTWYTDADGDGYGDDATAEVTCTPSPGAVQVGGDCDDTDPELIGDVVVFVFAAEGVSSGTAHYVITQGSNVYEGDIEMNDDFGAVYGAGSACLGSGCFSINIIQVDVPLQDIAIVRLTAPEFQQIEFDISEGFTGSNGQAGVEICDGIDNDCDGIIDEDCDVSVEVRVFLEGPYNASTGLMSDGVRALGLVPTIEPYTGLGYLHVGGGGESTTPAVLAVSGNDAIVDWVVLELRSPLDPAVIIASRSALLQRDGDVVDVDGSSAVSFSLAPGNYHLAIRHRNHLGCMTANSIGVGPGNVPVDLTSIATVVHGTQARRSVSGPFPAEVLWAGDVNFDGTLSYTGQDNDRDPILQAIGGVIPTNTLNGYLGTDVNLDGSVRYTGEDNDRDPILQGIGGVVPTNIRVEQLP